MSKTSIKYSSTTVKKGFKSGKKSGRPKGSKNK